MGIIEKIKRFAAEVARSFDKQSQGEQGTAAQSEGNVGSGTGNVGSGTNKKPADLADSLASANLAQDPGSSTYFEYTPFKNLVKGLIGNSQKTVEAGGIEPPGSWVTIPNPRQTTPTATPLYQEDSSSANKVFKRPASKVEPGVEQQSQGDQPATETQPRQRDGNSTSGNVGSGTSMIKIQCPYCSSADFVKRGTRQKKRERIQLYICKSCGRTFTPFSLKGKHYPLDVILDAISYYNLGFSLEQVSKIMATRRPAAEVEPGIEPQSQGDRQLNGGQPRQWEVQPSTIAAWYDEHKEICAYHRMRPFAIKEFSPYEAVETCTLAHRQLYRFRYHRAKIKYIMEDDFKHYKFYPLKEFLDNVCAETPHQYFQEGLRASEAPIKFSKVEMIVRSKENFATRLASLVLQGVRENKQRHETLQKFMLANDSVTVATEVPVYIKKEDLAHMQTQLGFELYTKTQNLKSQIPISKSQTNPNDQNSNSKTKKYNAPQPPLKLRGGETANAGEGELREMSIDELPRLITGHIDFLQIRNGLIHILDYKSNAEKERPIEQLTLYALALSRLTGLRVFHFKCAWFDEKDYFEFFPLHAVYKGRRTKRRRVVTKEGVYQINENEKKIDNIRPEKTYY